MAACTLLVASNISSSVMSTSVNAIESRKSFGYKWDNTPRTVNYYCAFTGSEKRAVQSVMNTWNNVRSATNGNKMITMQISSNKNAECYIKYVNEAWSPIGLTSPDVLGDSILGMEIAINKAYDITVGAVPGKYDLQEIVVHELGHSIGVMHCHEKDETSCFSPTCQSNVMNPFSNTNSTARRKLQQYDISSYQYIYR